MSNLHVRLGLLFGDVPNAPVLRDKSYGGAMQ